MKEVGKGMSVIGAEKMRVRKGVGREGSCVGEVGWGRRMWRVGEVGAVVERDGNLGVFPLGVWQGRQLG